MMELNNSQITHLRTIALSQAMNFSGLGPDTVRKVADDFFKFLSKEVESNG